MMRVNSIGHRVAWALALCASLGLLGSSVAAGQDREVVNLGASLAAHRTDGDVPGLAAAVFDSRGLVAVGVAGVRKRGDETPVERGDLWHIGSITKSFTSMLAARMVERGDLDWEATLADLLPDPFADSPFRDVTLSQLLSHRSGLPANLPMPEMLKLRTSPADLRTQRRDAVEILAASEPVSAPGEGFLYSNAGLITAGTALERLADQPWEELVRAEVLEPLGLSSAGFGAPGADDPEHVTQPRGHLSHDGKTLRPIVPGPFGDNPAFLGPAGTLHMSIADLAAYGREHLRGELGQGSLLQTETYRRLHRSRGDNYAFGWVDETPDWAGGRRAIWHNGSNTMWYAVVALIPEADLGFAVATNGSIRRAPVVHEVIGALFEEWTAVGAQDDFVDLLAGGLDGWQQRGGVAEYALEDGVLVGTAVADTPNSFLCTKRIFSDFVLELEFKVDDGLNSGIQIRSHAYDEASLVTVRASGGELQERVMPAGRVHGYQVEIDPSERAWSAGIYDEARRGWLDQPDGEHQEAARGAFKSGEWNRLRVAAIGTSIRTWLNGIAVADLDDDMTAEGFIGLQVHSVGGDDALVGARVQWRKVRIREVDTDALDKAVGPGDRAPR